MRKELSIMDRISRFIYGMLMLFVLLKSGNPIFILGIIPLYNSIFGINWIYNLLIIKKKLRFL